MHPDNYVMNYCHGWLKIWIEKHAVSNYACNIIIYNAQIVLQGMTNNVRYTFSVADTTRVVYNKYWAQQIGIDGTKYNIECGNFNTYKIHKQTA